MFTISFVKAKSTLRSVGTLTLRQISCAHVGLLFWCMCSEMTARWRAEKGE
jgi:hypothetical protein